MNNAEDNQAKMAMLVKKAQEEALSPVLVKEMYTVLAKDYKVRYDCFRREGFTMVEALRLTVGFYD